MVQTKLDKVISTLEQKQSYFRPVPLNANVICKAWCIRQGKDLAFFESELRSESSNELLAKASQTAILVPVVRKSNKSKM